MGMCSRQERIQKDIDVVIQKSRADKDCLFAGEFLSHPSSRSLGSNRVPSPAPAGTPSKLFFFFFFPPHTNVGCECKGCVVYVCVWTCARARSVVVACTAPFPFRECIWQQLLQ